MLLNKLKPKKEPAKPNPMEESQYFYYQDFGKVLVGLTQALELRQGDLNSVTTKDLLEFVDIDEVVFNTLFKDPVGVVKDVYKEIARLFDDADKMLSDMDAEMQITSIFKRFLNNYPMLDVLLIMQDHAIWESSLRSFVLRLAKNWPPEDTASWCYLYEIFCFQFYTILKKWRTSNYVAEKIPACVDLVGIWLEIDSMIGETTGDLLCEWETVPETGPAKQASIAILKPITKNNPVENMKEPPKS